MIESEIDIFEALREEQAKTKRILSLVHEALVIKWERRLTDEEADLLWGLKNNAICFMDYGDNPIPINKSIINGHIQSCEE